MKKSLLLLSIFCLGLVLPFMPSHAAVGGCLNDYLSFIRNSKSEHVRQQNISDQFKLNSCQLTDIAKVDDALDQIREELRENSTTCKDSSDLKKQYQKLLLETYFVRNAMKLNADYPTKEDEEAVQAHKEKIFEKLLTDMNSYFVVEEERVSSKELEQYFKEWKEKYSERIDKYANCDEGGWAGITDKWNDLNKTIQDIMNAFKKKDQEAKQEVEKEKEEPNAKHKVVTLKGWDTVKDLFDMGVKENVNKKKSVKDVVSSGVLDIDQVVNILEDSRITEDVDVANQLRLARYTVLYGYNSAPHTQETDAMIEEMNSILQEMSTVHLPQITELAQKSYKKQCN